MLYGPLARCVPPLVRSAAARGRASGRRVCVAGGISRVIDAGGRKYRQTTSPALSPLFALSRARAISIRAPSRASWRPSGRRGRGGRGGGGGGAGEKGCAQLSPARARATAIASRCRQRGASPSFVPRSVAPVLSSFAPQLPDDNPSTEPTRNRNQKTKAHLQAAAAAAAVGDPPPPSPHPGLFCEALSPRAPQSLPPENPGPPSRPIRQKGRLHAGARARFRARAPSRRETPNTGARDARERER